MFLVLLTSLLPSTRCLPPLSPLLVGATATVDEVKVKARSTLSEAWKRETEAWKREIRPQQLEAKISQLEAKNKEQDQELIQLMQAKSELEAEKSKIAILRQNVSSLEARLVRDCEDARRYISGSGVVTIYPDNSTSLQVYCDQYRDGGGWLVFQRRQDGSVDFYRNWTSYQKGFGDLNKEFWLGLDALYMLTSRQRCELRVDVMQFNEQLGKAVYSRFSISNSSDNYRLYLGTFIGGTAGDSLGTHNNMQFSTYDADHDIWHDNCARHAHGAWWYRGCDGSLRASTSNLNGHYNNRSENSLKAVRWNRFNRNYPLKFVEMKLRPA